MFKADPKRHPSCSHLMLLPRAASLAYLAPLGRIFYSQWGDRAPGPLLFSVFCFSKRPPACHPEAARPPTDLEIKIARPGSRVLKLLWGLRWRLRRGRGGAGCLPTRALGFSPFSRNPRETDATKITPTVASALAPPRCTEMPPLRQRLSSRGRQAPHGMHGSLHPPRVVRLDRLRAAHSRP